MRKSHVYLTGMLVLVGASALALHGCGTGLGTGAGGSTNYLGTSSPGDVWNFTVNHSANTFTGSTDGGVAGTTAWSLSGTVSTLNFGFLQLTVTSVTNGTQTAPTITIDGTHNIAYAFEVPQVVLLVVPASGGGAGGTGNMITAVYNIGTCTTGQGGSVLNGAYNYMRVGYSGTSVNATTSSVFGTVHFTPAGTGATLDAEADFVLNHSATGSYTNAPGAPLQNFSQSSNPSIAFSCSNGLLSATTGGKTITGTVAGSSSSGSIESALILDQGQGQGGILGFPGITPATNVLAGMTMNGLGFNNNSSGNNTQPIQITADSTGQKLTVTQITGNAGNLALGSVAAYVKINGYSNTGLVDAATCTDGTFTTCNNPVGGMLNEPSGGEKYVLAVTYLSSGTSPGTAIVVQQ